MATQVQLLGCCSFLVLEKDTEVERLCLACQPPCARGPRRLTPVDCITRALLASDFQLNVATGSHSRTGGQEERAVSLCSHRCSSSMLQLSQVLPHNSLPWSLLGKLKGNSFPYCWSLGDSPHVLNPAHRPLCFQLGPG